MTAPSHRGAELPASPFRDRGAAWCVGRAVAAAGVAAAALCGLTAAVPATARAEWSGARVVSASTTQQAESGTQPAISRDGRYVVFEGSYAGTAGVWRKRLADGALELVAAGGSGPSVSADGRFVAFTTSAALDPANDPNAVGDVYVRDMALSGDAAGAFTLASAGDGATTALGYSGGSGSAAAPRVALSADGRSVAFTVVSPSDLTGGAPGSTPGGQVALRRLDEQRTILVSTAIDRATREQTTAPVDGGATVARPASSAALSGDGTTVAWMATNVADQTRVVAGEPAAEPANLSTYVEPLWRRIVDGASAPVRRITGGGDPFAAACPAGGQASPDTAVTAAGANPCDGPFALSRAGDQVPGTLANGGVPPTAPDMTPQLSDDGWTAAILVAEPLRNTAVAPPRPATANAYVVDMRPELNRWQAVRALTAWASTDFGNDLLAADVTSVALSPDGRRVAFTTPRGAFPLSPPLLLDAPLGQVGDSELYDVDLARGETRRVTRQYDGGVLERPSSGVFLGGSFAAAYSGDGRRLVFASQAAKLFYGDGNGAVDAFVSDWVEPDAGPGPPRQAVTDPPAPISLRPRWRIGATARSRRDGRVAVSVVVPAAGSVAVSATVKAAAKPARKPTKRARAAASGTVVRVVAARRARARRAGLVVVVLAPRRGVRVPARGGLGATATVTFTAGGRRLRASLPVRFKRASKRSAGTGAPRTTSNRRGR
jgi:hypothetical protein